MIDVDTIPNEELGQTVLLMKEEAMRRGWKLYVLYVGSPHCYIDRGDGNKIHVFSSTPPTTSYAAAHLANNKFAAYNALREAGIPQQETYLVNSATPFENSIEYMRRLGRVVVKPVDGGHGKGITVNVTTEQDMGAALETAMQEVKLSSKDVLIQKQYESEVIYDIRVLCIGYKYVAAIWRVPARVIADGIHTVRELIEIENTSEERGKPYHAKLATIDMKVAEQYLKSKIDTVPVAGQEVFVLGIANYGAGGETIDITDALPGWLIALAERSSVACELPVAGVDFMIAATPRSDSSAEELQAVVIEINKCPSLSIHDSPTSGTPRPAAAVYMDYLASI